MKVTPAAPPSRLSMKFIAFVIPTIQNIEITKLRKLFEVIELE
jgi:hypothetical protein